MQKDITLQEYLPINIIEVQEPAFYYYYLLFLSHYFIVICFSCFTRKKDIKRGEETSSFRSMKLPKLAAFKCRRNVVTQIVQPYSYLRSYKENVENLRNILKKIDDRRRILEHEVQEEIRKGLLIEQDVENWLQKAKMVAKQIEKFLNEIEVANVKCFSGLCSNIKMRYQLSCDAKKRCEDALRLFGKGIFSHISYRVAFPHLTESPASKQSFKLRMPVAEEILHTLVDEKEKIVGIYGMPGIGKTKMAGIAVKKAEERKLFDKVAWVHVSQKPNLFNKIAESLGLSLDKSQSTNAWAKLGDRMKGKRILIVLDELWEAIESDRLNQIGDGCKFLLTTQSRDVCHKMRAKTFTLELLSDDESCELFRESIYDPRSIDPSSWAIEIIRECGGLPMAVIEVARRFDIEEKDQWMNTEAIGVAVTYCVMRSVNYFLKDDDDLKFFFICCLSFPKDSDIPIESLFRYQLGLMLFNHDTTLEQARSTTHEKVQTLTGQSLFLQQA